VWVLPAGLATVDPLELLKSPRIPDLLASLNAAFDWVLIDCPPLLPLADAEIISRMCDGTIVVVRRDKSPKSALKQALERVAPSKMAGILLNEFPPATTYSYPEYMIEQRPKSTGISQQVHRFWNWAGDARQRALRFCSMQFGRQARRGA
jgi:Mrp family chromosome partitioning ATPase